MQVLTISEMKEKALWVRREVLRMAVKANSGHVSTAMSQTEMLVSLYYGGHLKYDAANPKWEDRDIFLLSKGQGGIGLYPILADTGFFPVEDLDNFCGEGSHIGVHAEWHCPGVEMISGSLGHGLPVGTGIAKAFKDDGKKNLVFVMTGDGELHEGSNWEALMSASWFGLNNLIVIVDRNGQLTLGKTDEKETAKDGVGLEPLKEKFEAFGCEVVEVDGHDFVQIHTALSQAKQKAINKPFVIISNTKKGRGLSCMEDARRWHYRVPMGGDLDQCWDDLKVPAEAIPTPSYSQVKHATAMRDRFFDALYEHFKRDKNLVLITADNGFPSIEKWAAEFPQQLIQTGIAEQQMVGMAAGMAMQGKKVFCYAIAPFVGIRVAEFVKLNVAATELPISLIGIGAGFAYDIMCITHHCTEDISLMRSMPNITIHSPADGITAAAVADYCATSNHPNYIRLDRGGLDDLHTVHTSSFLSNGMEVARKGDSPICILATGVMTHRALEVAEELDATVVDVYRLKPIDTDILFSVIRGYSHYVTLEEHRPQGGLGSAVAEIFADNNTLIHLLRLSAEDRFAFELGGREVIHRNMGLDKDSIIRRIKEWINS